MAGNKNSGRRPREAHWGDAEGGGTKEVIIRTPLKEKAEHPIIKQLDRALVDVDDMDVTDFLKTVFDCGAEGLWVFRIVNGEEYKVGTLKPHMDFGDDGETFLLSHFGGPGTFVLKAAVKTAYGGMIRASKPKRIRLGLSSEQDAGSFAMPGNDADTIITRTLAREEKIHALNKIKDMNREPTVAKEEEGMKADELLVIVRELKGNDRTSEILLEMLKTERERLSALTLQQTQRNPLEMLAPIAAPVLAFLDKKLSPGMVSKWVEALRNPRENPEPDSIWSTLGKLATDFMPVIQPFLINAMQGMNGAAAVPVARPALARPPIAPTAPQPPVPQGATDEMATREIDDADTKEVLDYVMTCLDEHKFPEAWAALRSNEDLADVIAPIVPGPEPMAFWFKLREVDERMRTRKDLGLEFIAYIQTQIQGWIDQQRRLPPPAAVERGEVEPEPVAPSPAPPVA